MGGFSCDTKKFYSLRPRKQNLVVSHPSAYKNSVRGEAIYYLYLEVKGHMRLFFTGVKLGYKRRVKGKTGTTQVEKE